jgi:tRNA(Arg) A34 adenosine deaminase TadA
MEVGNHQPQDYQYLQRAVELSQQSPEPVGCGTVIVSGNGEVLAEAYNSQRADRRATHHAEIKAVDQANDHAGSRKIEGATAYCSCEPCAMCLTALSYANVGRIVFHKRMIDLFPDDPQSQLDPQAFVHGLNFVPQLVQLELEP